MIFLVEKLHTYLSGVCYAIIPQFFNAHKKLKFQISFDKNLHIEDVPSTIGVYFTSKPTESDIKQHKTAVITKNNLNVMSIYLAIRQVIEPNWTNNRDQFLHPNDNWELDFDFQNDCFTYILFHGQNKVSSIYGVNKWLPFTEQEVDAKEKFTSNFITDYIKGKVEFDTKSSLFEIQNEKQFPLVFSAESLSVFQNGRALWKYYHSKENRNVNASFYDIREYFQGRNDKGKMNNSSDDEVYTGLISELRDSLKDLAKKIEPKIYEYRFLKK